MRRLPACPPFGLCFQGGILKAAISIGALAVVLAALGLWWSRDRCERACDAAEREAGALFERGEPVAALARIDATDARCNCSRFTSGDAPPEYSLALACVRRLISEGREAEVRHLMANARGPILRELRIP